LEERRHKRRGEESGAIDGVQHSDGAVIADRPLGPRFPGGLFVTRDGENDPAVDGRGDATDFKLTRWDAVRAALGG
jgi:3-phytase